jgi:hypothetical protein
MLGRRRTANAFNRLNGSRAKSLSEEKTAMPKNSNRGGSNRSDNWSGGVMDVARDRPIAAAAVAAGAAAAGLFLWTRRSQISSQLSNLSEQIGEWTDNMRSDWSSSDDTGGLTTTGQSGGNRSRSSQSGMSETGGGNASLGRTTGGGGSTGSPSGRGRARSAPTTPQ